MRNEPIKIIRITNKKKTINTKIAFYQQFEGLIWNNCFTHLIIFYAATYTMKNTNRHEIEDTPSIKK